MEQKTISSLRRLRRRTIGALGTVFIGVLIAVLANFVIEGQNDEIAGGNDLPNQPEQNDIEIDVDGDGNTTVVGGGNSISSGD